MKANINIDISIRFRDVLLVQVKKENTTIEALTRKLLREYLLINQKEDVEKII
jgi:hypothetical protein